MNIQLIYNSLFTIPWPLFQVYSKDNENSCQFPMSPTWGGLNTLWSFFFDWGTVNRLFSWHFPQFRERYFTGVRAKRKSSLFFLLPSPFCHLFGHFVCMQLNVHFGFNHQYHGNTHLIHSTSKSSVSSEDQASVFFLCCRCDLRFKVFLCTILHMA